MFKRTRSDIYFSGDDAHAFLPWVISIMACLATLLLCLGVTVGSWIIDRGDSYSNSFTVNIPLSDNAPQKLNDIYGRLQKLPGITAIKQLSNDNLRDMLEPWIGNTDAIAALPLPIVFEVTTEPGMVIDYKSLQNTFAAIAPGTEVDGHERWIADFSHFSSAMRGMMGMLAILIIGGLALMIAFTSRASLKLHARTVQLLHSIGAEDAYITRQFQWEAFWLTLRGTIPGCIAAGLAWWLAGRYMASLESSVLPALTFTVPHIGLLLAMPLACGIVAWIAARLSVMKQLQRVL